MKIKDVTREYPNEELTIVWQPKKCIHAEKCWRNLPEVFRYKQKPWIDSNGASSERISNQINQCPSGALSYYWNKDGQTKYANVEKTTIQVVDKGPLFVKGSFEIIKLDGTVSVAHNAALCRCGASENKPFCDNSHQRIAFEQ
jgi:uncharacterized Fe-S cluster protein YjdI